MIEFRHKSDSSITDIRPVYYPLSEIKYTIYDKHIDFTSLVEEFAKFARAIGYAEETVREGLNLDNC